MSEGRPGSGEGSGESASADRDGDFESVRRLAAARERLAAIEERIDAEGEGVVEAAADAYRNARRLLDGYEDRATGTGRSTFAAYVQLEGQFAALVENLPEELSESDPFDAAFDAIDKSRLSESDFERARGALEPAERYVDLLAEREAAEGAYAEARTAANRRLSEIEAEIDGHERLLELASVDLDAPVERLREPIEAYDRAIREAFDDYLASASAREAFAFLERTRWYPLVEFERPPAELREYVETNPAGECPVPELLEYAEHSRSKLTHLVDDADLLKRRVATRRTYLRGLDADPLTIDWPPPPAAELRYRIRELRPLVARVADEAAVARLREVRELTRDPDYDRLQTAAAAATGLSDEERERLADGRVEAELAALRTERERLERELGEPRPRSESGRTD